MNTGSTVFKSQRKTMTEKKGSDQTAISAFLKANGYFPDNDIGLNSFTEFICGRGATLGLLKDKVDEYFDEYKSLDMSDLTNKEIYERKSES